MAYAKKALHLLNFLQHGGAENVVLNYCLAMQELNIISTVVAKQKSAEYEKYMSKIVSIIHRLSCHVLKESDYIFIHSNQRLFQLFFFFFFIKKGKKRIFYIQHLRYSNIKFKMLSFFINLICTDFIQITPVTENLIKQYIRINVQYINNFFIPKYSKNEYDEIKRMIRGQYDIASNKVLVTFSGVFRNGKGLPDFIELARSFRNDERFFFLVLGDGPEANYVKNYTAENLLWLGFVNDVEKYLIASDIYVFLSRIEMMPMALLEAMYCDNFILAYNTTVNNYVLHSHTYPSLSDIKTALQSNDLYRETRYFDIHYAKKMFTKVFKG